MKTKPVKKLWQGKYVSVRDYEIRSAIRQGGLKIIHKGKSMELNTDELSHLKPSGQPIQSQFKGTYQLVNITWKPLTEDINQRNLYE